jgi:hypothetical protein
MLKITFSFGLLLCLFFGTNCNSRSLERKFEAFDHFYYFDDQLKNLRKVGFSESEIYQYGKFDYKTASLYLYDLENWEVKKILKLKEYKENVLFIDDYDKLFLHAKPDLQLRFIKDKDNIKSYITGGYGEDLTTLDACKEHAKKVKKEIEDAQQCDGCQGPM